MRPKTGTPRRRRQPARDPRRGGTDEETAGARQATIGIRCPGQLLARRPPDGAAAPQGENGANARCTHCLRRAPPALQYTTGRHCGALHRASASLKSQVKEVV
jgi:hypothetical protein